MADNQRKCLCFRVTKVTPWDGGGTENIQTSANEAAVKLEIRIASFIIPRHGSHKVAPQVYLYYWYLFHCLIFLCSYAFYLLALHLQQFHW